VGQPGSGRAGGAPPDEAGDATAARGGGPQQTFPGLKALIDVDFALCSGEIVALVGQNGSGKSTLVKVITDIHEGTPALA
jgi:ABC-type sugar transport system ATPase subunit